jgi:hypothetical protein
VRFILAGEEGGTPLVLSRAESADRGSELVDLAAVVRPVAGALRGDRAIVMRLRLAKQVSDRA